MFERIIYQDWQLIFPLVALAVASCVYLAAARNASRMNAAKVDRVARLPHDDR